MGECLQSRLDKLGQMRVLDMHAHLAFLTGSGTEKWEQREKKREVRVERIIPLMTLPNKSTTL